MREESSPSLNHDVLARWKRKGRAGQGNGLGQGKNGGARTAGQGLGQVVRAGRHDMVERSRQFTRYNLDYNQPALEVAVAEASARQCEITCVRLKSKSFGVAACRDRLTLTKY